jgi:heme/copper-type cytochrome/quinol oxidase subunit 2
MAIATLHKVDFRSFLMFASSSVLLALTILVLRRMLSGGQVNFGTFEVSRSTNPKGYWFIFIFWGLVSLVWSILAILFLAFTFVGN